jgi:chemotaxis protein CheD
MTRTRSPASAAWIDTERDARAKLHYFDRHFKRKAIKVLPGEYFTTEEDIVLSTVLGSCVSACLRDAVAGVGGMNHFMLPDSEDSRAGVSARYGGYAMELLVNELLKQGARRERIEAKVFGGGHVLRGMSSNSVGTRNIVFVREYLKTEGIAIAAEDLGDYCARKVVFLHRSGQAFVRRIDCSIVSDDLATESAYSSRLRNQPVQGEVELFN